MLIVLLDCNLDVIWIIKVEGMVFYFGVMILIECFSVLCNGVDGLKFFLVILIGLDGLKVMLVVLFVGIEIYVVGGVGLDNFVDWFKVGVIGFGIGIVFYKFGFFIVDIDECVCKIVVVYDVVIIFKG